MAASELTTKNRKGYWITLAISWLLTIGPGIIFFLKGFVQGDTHTKVCMSMIMILSLVLMALMALMKAKLKRTLFWTIFIGIYMAMDSMASVAITFAICNIIDEIIVTPLNHKYKCDLNINKQIDKRGISTQ